MESLLAELQTILTTLLAAAGTALCAYAIKWLRDFLGIKESDSNEEAIRRAALTEAGKLVTQGKLDDPAALVAAAAKVIADLQPQVKAEGYDTVDVKDMIIGAAATVFPPAAFLKLFIK
jgi:hypothetical protein